MKKLIEFRKSHLKNKKYDAILYNTKTKRKNIIPFGAIKSNGTPYEQYKDGTGLGLYTKYDHLDKKRREKYRKRHGTNPKRYSPGYFSLKYLW
jgi:hypothetical protein